MSSLDLSVPPRRESEFVKEISEEFFRDIYENSPDMYCMSDLESGEIRACNQTFVEKLGLESKEEVVGRPELEFYHPDSRSDVERAYDRLKEEGELENVEVRMQKPDGEVIDVSLSATGSREEGVVTGSRTALRDITELKETERELRERTRRLEQSNEELEQFAYLASHDLQEPLRMVASYTELLARRYADDLDDRAQKYIDFAVDGAERMQQLINDLLSYSRIGRPDRTFEVVDLNDVVEDVVANLKLKIDQSDARVEFDRLPEVYGDKSLMVHLMQNLVENALKFRSDEPPVVRIDAECDGDLCSISVSDNGVGFDPDHADRIFQIFQRLHKRDAYEGTGAGLAIVKKIAENHGGSVSVDSEEGVGTTFTVELPAG